MASVLIIYSTTDGQTRKIGSRLKQVIEERDHDVALVGIDEAVSVDPSGYDKIVIGASIRYGKHHKKVYEFIDRNQQILGEKPSCFLSVNLVARKPGKNRADTNPYVKKFLTQIAWKPAIVEVVAGKLDYKLYSFRDRIIIRFIMWMTKGPTNPEACVEYTNWDQVEQFGREVSEL